MSHETFSLDELSRHLGRDRREIEKLVQRGRIPGRKVGDEWVFVQTEITQWLEQEMREYSAPQLAELESHQSSLDLDPIHPVSSVISLETIQIPLEGKTKRSVLESLVETAGKTWQIWEPAAVLKAIREREEVMPTTFDNGVAIPHPRNPLPEAVGQPIIVYARAFKPIPFGGVRGGMTDLFFLVISRDAATHLRLLARLSQMIREEEFLERLRSTEDPAESLAIIREYDDLIQRRTQQ